MEKLDKRAWKVCWTWISSVTGSWGYCRLLLLKSALTQRTFAERKATMRQAYTLRCVLLLPGCQVVDSSRGQATSHKKSQPLR